VRNGDEIGSAAGVRRTPPLLRSVLVVVTLSPMVVLGACGSAPSSPSAGPVAPAYPIACANLREPDCALVARATAARFGPDAAIVAMLVTGFGCPGGLGDCPDRLDARSEGAPLIETGDGRLWRVPVVAAGGALTVGDPVEDVAARVTATSALAGAPAVAFSLGHCGLLSPIDIDRSLWDPVGFVDGDHPAALNAADGHLRFGGPRSATFQTDDGFVLSLARRAGPKSYQLCD
jgi:hypothetical protein